MRVSTLEGDPGCTDTPELYDVFLNGKEVDWLMVETADEESGEIVGVVAEAGCLTRHLLLMSDIPAFSHIPVSDDFLRLAVRGKVEVRHKG